MKKRRSFRRFTLSLSGIAVIALMWRWATWYLYSLPSEAAIEAFTSITNNAFYTLSIIVVFAVTGTTITDWRTGALTRIFHKRGDDGDEIFPRGGTQAGTGE